MFIEELIELLDSDELKSMKIKKKELEDFREVVQHAGSKYLKQKAQKQDVGELIEFRIHDDYIEESTILKRLGIKVYPYKISGSTIVSQDPFTPCLSVPTTNFYTNVTFPTALFSTTTKEQAISYIKKPKK